MRKQRVRFCCILLILFYALSAAGAVAVEDAGLSPAGGGPLQLGNTDLNILSGGRMAESDSGLYYAEAAIYRYGEADDTLLVDAPGENLNILGDTLWYTVGDTLYQYGLSDAALEAVFTWEGGALEQLYVNRGDTAYFLSGGVVYACLLETGETEALAGAGEIASFLPTEYGLIWATGALFERALLVDGRPLTTDVVQYYTEGGHLVVCTAQDTYQIALSQVFDGAGEDAFSVYSLHDNVNIAPHSEGDACPGCAANYAEFLAGEVTLEDYQGEPAPISLDSVTALSVSQGQRNIIRRARQLHEVEWTPLSNRHSWRQEGSDFIAGKTYHGIPYGQPVDTGYVGYKVSVGGFVEAVNNHDSVFYSGYSNFDQKIAPYYSTDCSAFISYAWGAGRTTTYYLGNISRNMGAQLNSLQVGDALNNVTSHVVLVYDVRYNSSGGVSAVTILEETPPITKMTSYGAGYSRSLADLQMKYLNTGYSIFRYNGRDGVGYIHSCAVPIDGDTCGNCYVASPAVLTAQVSGGVSVTLSSSTPGATIYYTTNGTAPTTGSPVYSGPFTVQAGTKLRTIAAANGKTSGAVSYNVAAMKLPFEDVTTDKWYHDAVDYVYRAGIFAGASATRFEPERAITRGEFVMVLGRMAGVDPSLYIKGNGTVMGTNVNFRTGPGTNYGTQGQFTLGAKVQIVGKSGVWFEVLYGGKRGFVHGDYLAATSGIFGDVDLKRSYAGYVQWAAEKGLAYGTSTTAFSPSDSLNREQMSTFLYRYAAIMGITLEQDVEAIDFVDGGSISNYAKEAVRALQRSGVVSGVGDGRFAPKDMTTRAHVSSLLMRFDQRYG